MGAGTGDLGGSNNHFPINLAFDNPYGIPINEECYQHFRSALDMLIAGVRYVGGDGVVLHENVSGGNVMSIDLVFSGPLTGIDRKNFNRAFNRLLWGIRHCAAPGHISATNTPHQIIPVPQNWNDENTCPGGHS
jgi:hypothetical protein